MMLSPTAAVMVSGVKSWAGEPAGEMPTLTNLSAASAAEARENATARTDGAANMAGVVEVKERGWIRGAVRDLMSL